MIQGDKSHSQKKDKGKRKTQTKERYRETKDGQKYNVQETEE